MKEALLARNLQPMLGETKQSGNGHRELGRKAVEELSEIKTVFVSFPSVGLRFHANDASSSSRFIQGGEGALDVLMVKSLA
jgi:hypothetical protein